MDAPQIEEVLREAFGSVHTERRAGWVSIPCPLSPWTHERGRDRNPSAGVSIHPQGISVFSCYSCKNKMPFAGLLRKYATFSGEDLDALIEEVEEDSFLGPRDVGEWDARLDADTRPVMQPLKKAVYLDLYDPASGHPYVESRGIDAETCALLGLCVDPSDPADGEERILFPVYGLDKELYGYSGRATNGDALLKVRDYYGLKKAGVVLGVHLIGGSQHKYVLLTEGLFDYANGWQQGFPTLAVMHSGLTKWQAEILRDLSLPVYLFYDNDKAGRAGVAAAASVLHSDMPVFLVTWPDIWLEDDSHPDGGYYADDLGLLDAQEIQEMIDGATLYTPPSNGQYRQTKKRRVARVASMGR
jgi:hypothetical protein